MTTLHSHTICHCGDGYVCYECTTRAARTAGWDDGPFIDLDLTSFDVEYTPTEVFA